LLPGGGFAACKILSRPFIGLDHNCSILILAEESIPWGNEAEIFIIAILGEFFLIGLAYCLHDNRQFGTVLASIPRERRNV